MINRCPGLVLCGKLKRPHATWHSYARETSESKTDDDISHGRKLGSSGDSVFAPASCIIIQDASFARRHKEAEDWTVA